MHKNFTQTNSANNKENIFKNCKNSIKIGSPFNINFLKRNA